MVYWFSSGVCASDISSIDVPVSDGKLTALRLFSCRSLPQLVRGSTLPPWHNYKLHRKPIYVQENISEEARTSARYVRRRPSRPRSTHVMSRGQPWIENRTVAIPPTIIGTVYDRGPEWILVPTCYLTRSVVVEDGESYTPTPQENILVKRDPIPPSTYSVGGYLSESDWGWMIFQFMIESTAI